MRIALCIAALILAGCGGSTRVLNSYEKESFDGTLTQILVLNPGIYINSAEYGRDTLVAKLKAAGVDVLTREAFFRASDQLDRDKVKAALEGTSVDGVLVVTPAHISSSSRGRPTLMGVRGALGDFEDEIGYVLSLRQAPPTYRPDAVSVDVLVQLYDVASTELVWEQVIRTENTGSSFDAVDAVAPRIAREVVRSGLVAH